MLQRLRALAVVSLLALIVAPAAAQYPNKPIRLIVPFPAAGPSQLPICSTTSRVAFTRAIPPFKITLRDLGAIDSKSLMANKRRKASSFIPFMVSRKSRMNSDSIRGW